MGEGATNLPIPIAQDVATTMGELLMLATQVTAIAPISDLDQYESVATQRKKIKDATKILKEKKTEILTPIKDYFELPEKALKDADIHATKLLLDWDNEVARQQREKEAFLQSAIRQKAMAEAEKKAAAALKKGDEAKAETLIQEAHNVAVPVFAPAKPLPGSGVAYREAWFAEVSDFKAFAIWAITQGYFNLLLPCETELNKLARMHKKASTIPGIDFKSTRTLIQR